MADPAETKSINILDLPVEILFHIFSFLNEEEQINLSRVCKHLYAVVNDDLQWYNQLLKEIGVWAINNISDMEQITEYHFILRRYEEKMRTVIWDPEKLNKTIYLICSPKVNYRKRYLKLSAESSRRKTVLSMISSLFQKEPEPIKIPKFIMFGPGLETPGISVIARQIVTGHNSTFEAVGMCDGAAIAVKHEGELFHVAFLYSNTKALRKPLPINERIQNNKLFTLTSNGEWGLTESIKASCKMTSAIIYVIDATSEIENVDEPFPDLTLMIQQIQLINEGELDNNDNTDHLNNSHNVDHMDNNDDVNHLYLLVLACVPNGTSPRPALLPLLNRLNLWKYKIPWQVCLVTASNLLNISLGFNWLIASTKQCRK